jgi:hypothetical protein
MLPFHHKFDSHYKTNNGEKNTKEDSFSLFDQIEMGIYHNFSKKNVQAYSNKSACHFNTHKVTGQTKFEDMVQKCSGITFTYSKLISK